MIPKNITKNDVLRALEDIDKFGTPQRRDSTKYFLKINDNTYSPKYVISIANKYANGYELEPCEFGGGKETNSFLDRLGFSICSEQHKDIHVENYKKESEIKEAIIYNEENFRKSNEKIKIATVINSLYGDYDENLFYDLIEDMSNKADIILFPAGTFCYDNMEKYNEYIYVLENQITEILQKVGKSLVVCMGIDVLDNRFDQHNSNQLSLAIDNTGIIAMARKFKATEEEKGFIKIAKNSMDKEQGYNRVFDIQGKKIYMAVCNDIYGISQDSLENLGIDYILNTIHGFAPSGQGNSGDVDFARKGLVGASKQWNCPVFSAATYFGREIPERWPSGVMWDKGEESVKNWKYDDNILFPVEVINYKTPLEKVEIRIFEV